MARGDGSKHRLDNDEVDRSGTAVANAPLTDVEAGKLVTMRIENVSTHHIERDVAPLLDLHMPVVDGIQATRTLTAEHPEVAIVILTTYADDTSVLSALRAGARSYLTKDADRADIARALHSAARGLSVMDPAVHATLLAAVGTGSTHHPGETRALPDGSPRGRVRSWR